MNEPLPQLEPATARKIFIWQMLFFAALFALATVENIITVIADFSRRGAPLVTFHIFGPWQSP